MMTSITPLRIVERDDSLSEWLFGERIDDTRIINSDCRTLATLKTDDGRLLYVALTNDFDWICDHCDIPLYTDWTNVVVESIPSFDIVDAGYSFTTKVSLRRLPQQTETPVVSEDYLDIHKLGGESYWLYENPTPNLRFIGQITFPDEDDLLLDLNWPTGEMIVEILYDTIKQTYCVLWRMHA
jgi:hypothetical protein